jgi:ribosomal protein S12
MLGLKYGTHPLTISSLNSAVVRLKHELPPLTLSRNRKLAKVQLSNEQTIKAMYSINRQHVLLLPTIYI